METKTVGGLTKLELGQYQATKDKLVQDIDAIYNIFLNSVSFLMRGKPFGGDSTKFIGAEICLSCSKVLAYLLTNYLGHTNIVLVNNFPTNFLHFFLIKRIPKFKEIIIDPTYKQFLVPYPRKFAEHIYNLPRVFVGDRTELYKLLWSTFFNAKKLFPELIKEVQQYRSKMYALWLYPPLLIKAWQYDKKIINPEHPQNRDYMIRSIHQLRQNKQDWPFENKNIRSFIEYLEEALI